MISLSDPGPATIWARPRVLPTPPGLYPPTRLTEKGDAVKATHCSIDGCGKKHYARTWCRNHYIRWWENGDPLGKPRPHLERRVNNSGYTLIHKPGHPLATSPGARGLEHRINLYDVIGDGSHPCAYCGVHVAWGVDLQVDHIDSDITNNDVSNLCVCCGSCNSTKANLRRWSRVGAS